MTTTEFDLGYIHAALQVFENYLLSTDVYWSLPARPPSGSQSFPQLTLGNILLANTRLHARQLTPAQKDELDSLGSELEAIKSRWRAAWEKKAEREYHARLTLWKNFLEDYRTSPENNDDRYAYEVNRRVILELLAEESGNIPSAEDEMLEGLDKLLRTIFIPGEFIWNAELARGFPSREYWYLYGHLRSNKE